MSPARFGTEFEKLGAGCFATVYRTNALDFEDIKGQDRANVALKCVAFQEHDEKEEHHLASELYVLELLRKAQHPHILRFYKAFLERDWKGGYSRVLMLFSSSICTLWEVAHKAAALPRRAVESWLQELLLALNFLHEKDILHRDIRPQNIQMAPSISSGCLCIVVSDFGAAIQIEGKADGFDFHKMSFLDDRIVPVYEPLVHK